MLFNLFYGLCLVSGLIVLCDRLVVWFVLDSVLDVLWVGVLMLFVGLICFFVDFVELSCLGFVLMISVGNLVAFIIIVLMKWFVVVGCCVCLGFVLAYLVCEFWYLLLLLSVYLLLGLLRF